MWRSAKDGGFTATRCLSKEIYGSICVPRAPKLYLSSSVAAQHVNDEIEIAVKSIDRGIRDCKPLTTRHRAWVPNRHKLSMVYRSRTITLTGGQVRDIFRTS